MRLCVTLFISAFVFYTNVNSQTTQEEYNYVTKGYKVQIESGLDMKKGYEITPIDTMVSGIRKVELRALYRVTGEKRVIAAYMLIYGKEIYDGYALEYFCIPHPDSPTEIISQYWSALWDGSTNSTEKLRLITFFISLNDLW